MKVLNITDQPDGSAVVELELTKEERDLLIEHAFVELLKRLVGIDPK